MSPQSRKTPLSPQKNGGKNHLPKILVIVGPTASGKTDLAIRLARKFNGEIISADSRQIYSGMDIGTAKPEIAHSAKRKALSGGIPHYLLDIKNPDEDYTVAEYKRDAIKAIRGILRRNRLPILVGGTGLYIKAVVDNLDIPKVSADQKLRKNLELRIKNKGLGNLVKELLLLDPEAAYIVDLKNTRRVVRALEVAILTGKPFTAQRKSGKPLFDALIIGISMPMEKLENKINRRVDEMIEGGLVNEVKNLVEKYGENQKALDAIGYREIIDYLDADKRGYKARINADINSIGVNPRKNQRKSAALPREVTEEIKQNTRRYAKRQMTWFRKDKRIKWVSAGEDGMNLAKGFGIK